MGCHMESVEYPRPNIIHDMYVVVIKRRSIRVKSGYIRTLIMNILFSLVSSPGLVQIHIIYIAEPRVERESWMHETHELTLTQYRIIHS